MQANNMVTPFVFAVFIKSIITICCFAVNFVYVVISFPLWPLGVMCREPISLPMTRILAKN